VGLDVPGRLASWLLTRAEKSGTGSKRPGEIDVGRTQGELAAELGTTRATLNRALKGFEALGFLNVEGERVVLRDPDALATYTAELGDADS
jgi:CRP-like cAMP-binding protein